MYSIFKIKVGSRKNIFQNVIIYCSKENCFKINNFFIKILSKYSQMWSSFEDLNVKNTTPQWKFNLDNWFVKYSIFYLILCFARKPS